MADDMIVNLAECFQYPDPSNGDTVIKAKIQDYISLIGKKTCALVSQVNVQQNLLTQIASRVTILEKAPAPVFVLPSLFPVSIANPKELLSLDVFAQKLEQQFSYLRNALGGPDDLFEGIQSLANSNSLKALGTTGGNLSSVAGWKQNLTIFTEAFVNLALMVTDLRSAVRNIQLSCCSTSCNSVAIDVQSKYFNRTLVLYFTGTIPDTLVNSVPSGCLLKIEDYSGNYINVSIDIKSNMNISSGVAVDLTSTPLNFLDNLKVTGIYSLTDPDAGSVCQRWIEELVDNTVSCPTLGLVAGFTTITGTFTHIEGIVTYSLQLFDSTNTMIGSYNVAASNPATIQYQFTGLNANTAYKVRIQIITASDTKTCPFSQINTLPNPCPAPTAVTAELEY